MRYGILVGDPLVADNGVVVLLIEDNGQIEQLVIENVAVKDINVQTKYRKGAGVSILDHRLDFSDGTLKLEDPTCIEVITYYPQKIYALKEMDAKQLSALGDLELKNNYYEAAIELYTMSIDKLKAAQSDDQKTKQSLASALSNRALCHLKLGMLVDAYQGIGDSFHEESPLWAGLACIELQEHLIAARLLELAANERPEHAIIRGTLTRAKVLLSQSTSGCYGDFLTEYFLSGKNPTEAPRCSDYLGPVEIRLTEDGKGRGLFATEDVEAGKLIMVSNAIAVVYQEPGKYEDLVNEIVAKCVNACLKSHEFLRQIYTLDEFDTVPSMLWFGPNRFYRSNEIVPEYKLDIARIRNIVETSSYTKTIITEISSQSSVPVLTALTALPSFINNSCIPNMSRIEVGSAVFFHANRDISAGDELTCAYVDMHLPWATYRRDRLNFECNCQRCGVEKVFHSQLKGLAHILTSWIDKYGQEAMQVLGKLAVEIENCIEGATENEKHCIRTSFIAAYVAYHKLKRQGEAPPGEIPSAEVVMESLRYCAPGNPKTLVYLQELKEARPSDIWKMIGNDCGSLEVIEALARQRECLTGIYWVPTHIKAIILGGRKDCNEKPAAATSSRWNSKYISVASVVSAALIGLFTFVGKPTLNQAVYITFEGAILKLHI